MSWCKTLLTLVAALTAVGIACTSAVSAQRAGLLLSDERAYPGYTLVAPISSTTTYLIDIDGEVVHTWESSATVGNAVYLLESGHILRTESVVPPGERKFGRGGADWKCINGIACNEAFDRIILEGFKMRRYALDCPGSRSVLSLPSWKDTI